MKIHTAGKGGSFPPSLALSLWDTNGAGSMPCAHLLLWWDSTRPAPCDLALHTSSHMSAEGTAAFQCPPEAEAWFVLVLSSGTMVSACSSAWKGDYPACQDLNYLNPPSQVHAEPGTSTNQQHLSKTNCWRLIAEHRSFGTSDPKYPGHDCFPADHRNAVWPLRAAACRSAAISNSISAPHLMGGSPDIPSMLWKGRWK